MTGANGARVTLSSEDLSPAQAMSRNARKREARGTEVMAVEATIKGLVFDGEGPIMLLHEWNGFWGLPGGRLQLGETFAECLSRECERECEKEMGVGGAAAGPLESS